MAILCAEVIDRKDTMPRSKKNSERIEQVRKDKRRSAKLEPLRTKAEQPDKLYNDLAKFPSENPYPVLRIYKDGTVLYANKASEGLLKARGSGMGQQAPAEWLRIIKKGLSSDQVIREETEHEGRVFALRAVPIADSDYVNFYGVDITERKRAEEALRSSENKYRTLLENLPQKIFLKDRNSVYISCNENYAGDLKIKAPVIAGKTDYDFYPKELADKYRADDKRIMEEDKTEEFEEEYPQEGEKRWVHTVKTPVKGPHGNLIGILGIFWDITERKQAEEALRESETRFRTLADESFDSIVIHDGQRILEVNKAFGKIWGCESQKAVGAKLDDFVTPASLEVIKDRIRSGYDKPYEAIAVRKDGTQFNVEITGKPVTYKGRTMRIATMRDITERKRAEEILERERDNLSGIFEVMNDGVYIVDQQYDIQYVNRALQEEYGPWKGIKCYTYFHDRTEICPWCPNQKVFAGETVRWEWYSEKNGKTYDLIDTPLKGPDGSILKLEIFRDITERKQAEEQLQEERNLLRTLIDHIPDGVYVKDKDSRFVICNKAVAGYWEAEGKGNLIGKTDFDLFEHTKAQVFFDEEQKLMRTGKLLTNLDRQITDKAGNIHYGLTTKAPLKDSRGDVTGLVGINRDITERKKTEQKLLEYQKRLKRLASQLALAEERERRRIAGELHDQVNQSLALAKIKLDALRASITYQPLVEALKETCDSLEKAIQDTRSLTFDLSNPILYELGFEEAVAEWLREQVQEKRGIATEFMDDGLNKPLDDDVRILLFRNVRELLINCIKHANAGKVRVGIRRTDESIEVTVEDNGVGFDTAEVRSLSSKRAEFGLFSIRESLEELGGRFEIESKPGAGCKATMIVSLKRKGIDDERNKATHQGNGN
jgi:PAS domain S-box-containing protein